MQVARQDEELQRVRHDLSRREDQCRELQAKFETTHTKYQEQEKTLAARERYIQDSDEQRAAQEKNYQLLMGQLHLEATEHKKVSAQVEELQREVEQLRRIADNRPIMVDQEVQTDVVPESPDVLSEASQYSLGSLVLSEKVSPEIAAISPASSPEDTPEATQIVAHAVAPYEQHAQQETLETVGQVMQQAWAAEMGHTAEVRAKYLALVQQLGGKQQAVQGPVASTSAAAAALIQPILGGSSRIASLLEHPEKVFALLGIGSDEKRQYAVAHAIYAGKLYEAQKAIDAAEDEKNKQDAQSRFQELQQIGQRFLISKLAWHNFCSRFGSETHTRGLDLDSPIVVQALSAGVDETNPNPWISGSLAAKLSCMPRSKSN